MGLVVALQLCQQSVWCLGIESSRLPKGELGRSQVKRALNVEPLAGPDVASRPSFCPWEIQLWGGGSGVRGGQRPKDNLSICGNPFIRASYWAIRRKLFGFIGLCRQQLCFLYANPQRRNQLAAPEGL